MSASFISLGHVFYTKRDNDRDHAKMDPTEWHNRATVERRPVATVRRYREMIKTR
jgi:hypothetical protein